MKEHSLARERNDQASLKWDIKIIMTLPGWIALGGGIHSLQRITQSLGNDMNYTSFMDNWMAWVVVSFCATGWFVTHWMEIALLHRQISLARVLVISFLHKSEHVAR